jgi:hypothetical protein
VQIVRAADGQLAARVRGHTAAAARRSGSVLLIDTFERCQALEIWLCQRFLPSLPATASWSSPAAAAGPGLAGRPRPGRGPAHTSPCEPGARRLGRAAGPAAGSAGASGPLLLAFAGGHPLALSLAAEVATRTPAPPAGRGRLAAQQPWEAGPGRWWAGCSASLSASCPRDSTGRAVELCAHVEYTPRTCCGRCSATTPRAVQLAARAAFVCRPARRACTRTTSCAPRWRPTCAGGTRTATSACTPPAAATWSARWSQAAEPSHRADQDPAVHLRRSPLIIEAFCFRDPDGEYAEEYHAAGRRSSSR